MYYRVNITGDIDVISLDGIYGMIVYRRKTRFLLNQCQLNDDCNFIVVFDCSVVVVDTKYGTGVEEISLVAFLSEQNSPTPSMATTSTMKLKTIEFKELYFEIAKNP